MTICLQIISRHNFEYWSRSKLSQSKVESLLSMKQIAFTAKASCNDAKDSQMFGLEANSSRLMKKIAIPDVLSVSILFQLSDLLQLFDSL